MKRSILFGILLCVLLLSICFYPNISDEEYISQNIGIALPKFEDKKYTNNKDWFGDGAITAKYQFDREYTEALIEQIRLSKQWNALPLTENLNLILYGDEQNIVSLEYKPGNEAKIPLVKNGYCFFCDENGDETNKQDDKLLLERGSLNFQLAIYDTDNNTLYYFELDT